MATNPSRGPRGGEIFVRDIGYAKRLLQACEANFHCPPMNKGRLIWLASELGRRMKTSPVKPQAVARWLNGESKPREAKNNKLAELLGVDSTWLYLGVEQDLTPRERRVRNAMADGVVNVVAGLIQMDGGYPTFPDKDDTRATDEHIDLRAIIKGANYSFHVTLGTRQDSAWQFIVPIAHENVVILGVVREGFAVRIVELTEEMISETGVRGSGRSIAVKLDEKALEKNKLESFAARL